MKKYAPYVLAILLIIVLLLVVFRDKINEPKEQFSVAETIMNNENQYIIPMIQLSQKIKSLQAKSNSLIEQLEAIENEQANLGNYQFFIQSLNAMIDNLDSMSEQLSGMIANKKMMSKKGVREEVEAMRKSLNGFIFLSEEMLKKAENIIDKISTTNSEK